MTDPIFTEMDHNEVTDMLGTYWPVPNTATTLTLPPDCGITTGSVAVYPVPGRPGRTWWAVNGSIPPQAAGVPGQALADLLPGSVLVIPDPPPDHPIPPQT